MALSSAIVWEVRTTGHADNGAGFKAGASGTDRSQSDTPHVTFDGVTITATTAGASATMTLSGYTVIAGDVGNVVNITGGVNFTAGRYEITSVNTGLNTWTCDRNVASGIGSAMTGRMGGAVTLISTPLGICANGNIIYVKATASYSIAAGLTANTGNGTVTYNKRTRVVGYTTTRGDNGRATILATAGITLLTISGDGWTFENLIFDGDDVASTTGVSITGNYSNALVNCKVMDCAAEGVKFSGVVAALWGCEVTGCSGTTAAVHAGASLLNLISGSFIHDNDKVGAYQSGAGGFVVEKCVIANNTGASSDGILVDSYGYMIRDCSIYNNGRDGIRFSTYDIMGEVVGNVLTENDGYGINNAATGDSTIVDVRINYNAFLNNTSGARNGYAAGPNDVTLTGDPFTSVAGNDFSLNNTAGAGAACRAVGYPGALIAGGTGYLDIGALQRRSEPQGRANSFGFVIQS